MVLLLNALALCTQSKCREWGLGGKDNKDNLRAKLLRKVRQELGLPVFGPDNVPPGSVRQPQVRAGAGLEQCAALLGCAVGRFGDCMHGDRVVRTAAAACRRRLMPHRVCPPCCCRT